MAKKDVRLIVGLGNPGEKYAHTRHNAGFEVMARLESRFGVRVRKSGGPGTHNGMRSIVSCIGTQEFPRIRVGTGDRPAGEDLVEWVLGHPGPEEKEKMDAAFDKAAECAVLWAQQDIDAAMRGNK